MEGSLAVESLRLPDCPTRAEVAALVKFLEQQGTFAFPAYPTGLFSAAAGDSAELAQTGYRSVWIRDNIHIAHALLRIGQADRAIQAVKAIAQFLQHSEHRFQQCIANPALAVNPMNRPHIRFDGERLVELPEKWSHAQNDALGAFLGLYCHFLATGQLPAGEQARTLLTLFIRYFAAIRYWKDEDSGHWEESRKQSASSIGVALAGLKSCQKILPTIAPNLVSELEMLIVSGEEALGELLPFECRTDNPAQFRRYDAALLFLIVPWQVVSTDMARTILREVQEQLAGPIGICRYRGDSYWCADYKELLSAEVRTSDFSDNLSARDQLLKPGLEAQWCLFDSIMSIAFGQLYKASQDSADRLAQIHHLNRSLAQLTNHNSRFGPYRCPESYYCERGTWVPNDITPLLWTQANLRWALHEFEQSCD